VSVRGRRPGGSTEGRRQGGRDGGDAVGESVYMRDPDGNLLEFILYGYRGLREAAGGLSARVG